MISRKSAVVVLVLVVLAGGAAIQLFGHCQIPCGIYNDPVRVTLMEEHVTTIERSMKQIESLAGEGPEHVNQVVRWVSNKEKHADELTSIATYYFMAQRVKPADTSDAAAHAKYVDQITTLHRIVIHAMKAKQSTDLAHVKALRGLIAHFKASYFAGKDAAVPHKHGK